MFWIPLQEFTFRKLKMNELQRKVQRLDQIKRCSAVQNITCASDLNAQRVVCSAVLAIPSSPCQKLPQARNIN